MKKHAYHLLLFLSSNNLHIYILLFFTNDLRWINMDIAGKYHLLHGQEKVTPRMTDKITVKKQKTVFKVLICLCVLLLPILLSF